MKYRVFLCPHSSLTAGENEGWIRKNAQAKRLCFSENRCFGVMKNKKIEIIYGDPKKLSSFKKAGKAASIQSNFSAATSLLRKKFIKPKL